MFLAMTADKEIIQKIEEVDQQIRDLIDLYRSIQISDELQISIQFQDLRLLQKIVKELTQRVEELEKNRVERLPNPSDCADS